LKGVKPYRFHFINISIFYLKIDCLSNFEIRSQRWSLINALPICEASAPKHSARLSLVLRGVGRVLLIFSALQDPDR
jgi:hypothetical protein